MDIAEKWKKRKVIEQESATVLNDESFKKRRK